MLPASSRQIKVRRIGYLFAIGSVLGAIGTVSHDYYLKWKEMNSERERKLLEMRENRFLKDKETFGDEAYDMQRRDTKSYMPSWWPIRAVSDEEYEKMLENKVRLLQRQRIRNEMEEKEREQARNSAQPPKDAPR